MHRFLPRTARTAHNRTPALLLTQLRGTYRATPSYVRQVDKPVRVYVLELASNHGRYSDSDSISTDLCADHRGGRRRLDPIAFAARPARASEHTTKHASCTQTQQYSSKQALACVPRGSRGRDIRCRTRGAGEPAVSEECQKRMHKCIRNGRSGVLHLLRFATSLDYGATVERNHDPRCSVSEPRSSKRRRPAAPVNPQ